MSICIPSLQKPLGLLAIMDEESRFPQASDATLVEKMATNCTDPVNFQRSFTSNLGFSVTHYAGTVSTIISGSKCAWYGNLAYWFFAWYRLAESSVYTYTRILVDWPYKGAPLRSAWFMTATDICAPTFVYPPSANINVPCAKSPGHFSNWHVTQITEDLRRYINYLSRRKSHEEIR